MSRYGEHLKQHQLRPDTADSHRVSDPHALAFLDNIKGPERTLPQGFKLMASQKLGGFDMDKVKVFEDPGLESIGQPAYARGDEIHVAPGQMKDDVLLHESTHLAQQSAGHTGDLEVGANQVASGGAFQGGAAPVSASAAPAQGIFGWGKRKKRRAEKKAQKQQMEQNMHVSAQSHLKNQQRREIRENLHPSLHGLAPDTFVKDGVVWDDAQISSMPTYSMEQQSHVIQGAINRNMDSARRSQDSDAFAQFYFGKQGTTEYAGEMGRRIEAMYQTDEVGGAGRNYGYNRNLFETAKELKNQKDEHKEAYGNSEMSLDNDMIERLGSIFSHVTAYANEYANKSDEAIKHEVYQDYMTMKKRAGEIHAMHDMLQGISGYTQDMIWFYSGSSLSAQQGIQIFKRVNDLWLLAQREVGQGMGAGNIGTINTYSPLFEEKRANMRPSLLAQAGRQRMLMQQQQTQ